MVATGEKNMKQWCVHSRYKGQFEEEFLEKGRIIMRGTQDRRDRQRCG